MTKRILILITLFTAVVGLSAKEVSQQVAVSKAVQMMQNRIDDFNGQVASIKAVSYEGHKAFYVVQFAPEGWALIAADDTSAPLIGYSERGVYETEDQPYNMQCQMDVYGYQIINNSKNTNQQHADWQTVNGMNQRAARRADDKIAPLIHVTWNQTKSYQKYCPEDGGNKAVVGCVAVGMAQAMSVAQWPQRPVGEFGYNHQTYGYIYINYDKEPDYNWSNILSGANSNDDVARLLYHCGVAVRMDYSPSGSGTQTSYIPGALQRNFQYPASVKYYNRSGFSDADWKQLILTELQEGRAVAYCGHDPKKNYGHCFNLDGYDGNWFHVNWGWGGSNDGYFSLDGLRDNTMDMDYTDGQGVVVGIRPPSDHPSNITLSNTTVSVDAPVGTVIAKVTVESEATNPTYTYTIRGEYSPRTHKYRDVPFTIENDQLITTEAIDPEAGDRTIEITAKNNQNGYDVTRSFTIKVTTTGIQNVTWTNQQADYFTTDGQHQATLRKGLNIVRQRNADGSIRVNKIIIK